MIEGLHADVGGNELRVLLLGAAEKAEKRALEHRDEVTRRKAEAVVADVAEVVGEKPGGLASGLAIESSLCPWRAPARWAETCERKERYRLSESDLGEIGVLG